MARARPVQALLSGRRLEDKVIMQGIESVSEGSHQFHLAKRQFSDSIDGIRFYRRLAWQLHSLRFDLSARC